MATSFSKAILVGRLVRDPETKKTSTGKTLCRFSLAVDKPGKDNGTSFLDVVAWDKQADIISQYAKKGSAILVEGRLDQRTYEKDGKKQSYVSVVVSDFQFVGGGSKDYAPSPEEASKAISQAQVLEQASDDEINYGDIPF